MVCSKDLENINIKMNDDALSKYKNCSIYVVYLQKMGKIKKTKYKELKKLKLYLIIKRNYSVRIPLVWK